MATAPTANTPTKAEKVAAATKQADLQRFKQVQRTAVLLKQVSDATRVQLILRLANGEQNVGTLSSELAMSQPAVSHHLALLRHGRIIAPRRQGTNNFYALTETGVMLAEVIKGVMG